ncbi:hypothetical protein EJ08DRAFT_645786 [Tothia fuscella]|uniref:Mitochondrial intermembrane space import and assembly protein 40 n=1 Tax=Tothia fuscella TaxID=1048955 RepID=A0A9P4P1B8_9PEZI|nr:hypothetical protein EJ08DRAFT_645786 [Tothia fuscella]
MIRPAYNCFRGSSLRAVSRTSTQIPRRRFISTAPKRSTWKGAAVRWGLAGAAVYYYNTSNVFAEELALIHEPPLHTQSTSETTHLTLDSIAARKQSSRDASSSSPPLDAKVIDPTTVDGPLGTGGAAPGSPEELEEEAGQEGAFNPETGEINWDCPCLGGMANGPCGDEFKAAFSCFVYSQEEPKGVDCIEKFKGMQDCFRQHPDIYGAELDDDDDDGELDATTEHAASNSTEPPSEGGATPSSPNPEEAVKTTKIPEHTPHAKTIGITSKPPPESVEAEQKGDSVSS